MTLTIIISICSLLLISYIFDLTSSWTKIPSVILLLLLGWIARQFTQLVNIEFPDFSMILPILGTIGLILIVLEGSLELELNRSKLGLIRKSFIGALLPIFLMAFLLALLFMKFGNHSLKDSLVNAIPFCIISSAIAIPSVRRLTSTEREFIIYESSLSDILGVILFNFIALNTSFGISTFGHFGLQLIIIFIISLIATIGLSLLLSKIEHHIKFMPIIVLVILIYAVSKVYHLPALVFILFFGLFLGNLYKFKRFKKIEEHLHIDIDREVLKFKELTIEATFLVKSLFFLLFGYLIETSEILNPDTIFWSIGIVFIILAFRTIQLRLSDLPLKPLLFVAPRGLITILLFLSIEPAQRILLVNNSLVIQVIVLTALVMMVGLMATANYNGFKAKER